MIYFIADTHFNHNNIIEYCKRPFKNAKEMDGLLIANWNSVVKKPTDVVYMLGDFMFYGGRGEESEYFAKLNGKKHLLRGNHDFKNPKVFKLPWESQNDLKTIKYLGTKFILCHYPLQSWDSSCHGSIHIHGHIHEKVMPMMNRICVSVEQIDYKPISIDEILGVR